MPSILSGDSLLILDPHFTWSREVSPGDPGGPVYGFTEASEDPDMHGQLTAFGSILKDFKNKFSGTIVRLPLRTKSQAAKSKIVSDKGTSEREIIEVFELFSSELVESLLFLRNIHSITLRIDNDIYAKAESTTGVSHHKAKEIINKGYSQVFVKQERDICEEDFLTDISLYRGEAADSYKTGKEEKFKYALSHHMRKTIKDAHLQKWARSQKLFPWIAIATPLEVRLSLWLYGCYSLTLIFREVQISLDDFSPHSHYRFRRSTPSTSTECFPSPPIGRTSTRAVTELPAKIRKQNSVQDGTQRSSRNACPTPGSAILCSWISWPRIEKLGLRGGISGLLVSRGWRETFGWEFWVRYFSMWWSKI